MAAIVPAVRRRREQERLIRLLPRLDQQDLGVLKSIALNMAHSHAVSARPRPAKVRFAPRKKMKPG